ncbi:MAG: NfeD family protein [Hyphomicrobiaceae bacterium]
MTASPIHQRIVIGATARAGRSRGYRLACALLAIGAWLLMSVSAIHATQSGPIFTLEVKGPIGVATSMHLCRALDEGRKQGVELVVVKLDTPGGLLNATRDVIQCILASAVPVAIYIFPSGARAASAGTYITYAAHIAAMAPGTHLGAATPVAITTPLTPREPTRPGAPKSEKDAQEPATDRKVLNDAIAYLQSLAQLRGRNIDWAEKAVREAATLTAEDAARERVVDILANDVRDLLAKIDGRTVSIAGVDRRISTQGRAVVDFEPDWRTRFLGAIADPNIALILLMIGVYGLLFEFWSPGALVPGVIGGISLMLGLVALSLLPVSYAGLALLLLGVALMVAEAFAPGLGILGIGGLVAFVVGALFLFDPAASDIDLSLAWPVVFGAALTSVLLLSVVLGFAIRARYRPAMTGAEEMIGLEGQVVAWQGGQGAVRVHGEVWSARGAVSLQPGQRVRVAGREGMTLTIAPL